MGVCVLAFSTDIFWILRWTFTRISCLFYPNFCPINSKVVSYGITLPQDTDYFLIHMNNARYFREMDFAKTAFFYRTGMNRLYWFKQCDQRELIIRYRQPLFIGVPFKIQTRIIWADQHSFYLEHLFITLHDNFVRSVAWSHIWIWTQDDVGKALASRFGLVLPDCTPETLGRLIRANDISAERLGGAEFKRKTKFLCLSEEEVNYI